MTIEQIELKAAMKAAELRVLKERPYCRVPRDLALLAGCSDDNIRNELKRRPLSTQNFGGVKHVPMNVALEWLAGEVA